MGKLSEGLTPKTARPQSAFRLFGIRRGGEQGRIGSIGDPSPRVKRTRSLRLSPSARSARSGEHFLIGNVHAEEGTRTPTAFRPPAPKAGASANSATSAWAQYSIGSGPQLSLPMRPRFVSLRRERDPPGENHATLHEVRGCGRGQRFVLPCLRVAAIGGRVSGECGGAVSNG